MPEHAPRARRKRLLLALALGTLVIASGTGLSFWLYFEAGDIEPPDLGDLEYVWPELPDEQNGFLLVNFDSDDFDLLEEDIAEIWATRDEKSGVGSARGVESGDEDDERVDEIDEENPRPRDWTQLDALAGPPWWDAEIARLAIERNSRFLGVLERALELEGFDASRRDRSRNPFSTWRRLYRLLGFQFRLGLDAGDTRAPVKRAETIFEFGRRVAESGAGVIGRLVGAAFEGGAIDMLGVLVKRARSPASLRALLESAVLEPRPGDAVDVFVRQLAAQFFSEFSGDVRTIGAFLGMTEIDFAPPRYLENRTVALIAEDFRALRRVLPEPGRHRLRVEVEELPFALSLAGVELFPLRNSTGIQLRNVCVSTWRPSVELWLRIELKRELARLVAVLRLHELEHGRLPGTLADLVPELLGAVPNDPFDGQPIRYSRELRCLWSPGEDFELDPGTPWPRERADDDPRPERLEFLEAIVPDMLVRIPALPSER